MCGQITTAKRFPLPAPIWRRIAGFSPSLRICVSAAGILALLLCFNPIGAANARDGAASNIAQKDASLKEALEKGLRARRPSELAFIGRVVAMVDQGQLPLDLVRSPS